MECFNRKTENALPWSFGRKQELIPLRLKPCYKDYLWGGARLKSEFGKADAPDITAESWELADHPDGCSLVAEGDLAGTTLSDLGTHDRNAFWGSHCREAQFPILVKLIDASKPLSVQVHPSDQTAMADRGERGKTELWYVVDAKPHAFLFCGFSKRVTREEFCSRVRSGTVCEVLNRIPVSPGDVFCILPGTVHAIGPGVLIAEIQQNSNTTFRIFDYFRRDNRGELRPLHLERAEQAASLQPIIPSECRANSVAQFPAYSFSEMFSCAYFRAFCMDIRRKIELNCDGTSFHHLLCVEGKGEIICRSKRYGLGKGDSFFMPAELGVYEIEGSCRVLLTKV